MSRAEHPDGEWVGLSEASRLLGVAPATLRRWSDAGRVRVYTTPGGHRRFSRGGLERLLPAATSRRPSLEGAGLTPARIASSYRRASRQMAAELPWVGGLSDPQRTFFRGRGQELTAILFDHLTAVRPESAARSLGEAATTAAGHGRAAADLKLSLSQTVEGFLRFRAPFHHQLGVAARRGGFDVAQTARLLETAERAMDRLLMAVMEGYAAGAGRRRRTASPAEPPPSAPGWPEARRGR